MLATIQPAGAASEAVSSVHRNPSAGLTAIGPLATLTSFQTFEELLSSPAGVHRFMEFLEREQSTENLSFYLHVLRLRANVDCARQIAAEVKSRFIADDAPLQVNLTAKMRASTEQALDRIFSDNGISQDGAESPEDQLQSALEDIKRMMFTDSYRRFVRFQLQTFTKQQLSCHSTDSNDASRKDMRRLAGLGDCFVLTDPSIPDNPIVASSHGFGRLTGFGPADINGNCRFLQGEWTQADVIQRIRAALSNGTPICEVLVNYRKTGEPFWNLLHIIPLKNDSGGVSFFLGAQIDITPIMQDKSSLQLLLGNDNQANDEVDKDLDPLARGGAAKTLLRFGSMANLSSVLRRRGKPKASAAAVQPKLNHTASADGNTADVGVGAHGDLMRSLYSRPMPRTSSSSSSVLSSALVDDFTSTYSTMLILELDANRPLPSFSPEAPAKPSGSDGPLSLMRKLLPRMTRDESVLETAVVQFITPGLSQSHPASERFIGQNFKQFISWFITGSDTFDPKEGNNTRLVKAMSSSGRNVRELISTGETTTWDVVSSLRTPRGTFERVRLHGSLLVPTSTPGATRVYVAVVIGWASLETNSVIVQSSTASALMNV